MTNELKQVKRALAKAKYALLAVLLIAVAVVGVFSGCNANKQYTDGAVKQISTETGAKLAINEYRLSTAYQGSVPYITIIRWSGPDTVANAVIHYEKPNGEKGTKNIGQLSGVGTQTESRVIPLSDICSMDITGIYTFYMTGSGIAQVDATTIFYNAPVPLPPNPTKEGHAFVGWYFDGAFTQAYDGRPIYEDTQLFAKFQINTYTVSYDTNGGTACDSATINWNTVAPLPTITKVGHTFKGWYLNGVQYAGQQLTANATLTAEWEVIIYTVTFIADGVTVATLQVPYGTPLKAVAQQADLSLLNNFILDGDTLTFTSIIENDMQISVVETTGFERFIKFATVYWYVLVGGVVLLIIGIVILVKKVKG